MTTYNNKTNIYRKKSQNNNNSQGRIPQEISQQTQSIQLNPHNYHRGNAWRQQRNHSRSTTPKDIPSNSKALPPPRNSPPKRNLTEMQQTRTTTDTTPPKKSPKRVKSDRPTRPPIIFTGAEIIKQQLMQKEKIRQMEKTLLHSTPQQRIGILGKALTKEINKINDNDTHETGKIMVELLKYQNTDLLKLLSSEGALQQEMTRILDYLTTQSQRMEIVHQNIQDSTASVPNTNYSSHSEEKDDEKLESQQIYSTPRGDDDTSPTTKKDSLSPNTKNICLQNSQSPNSSSQVVNSLNSSNTPMGIHDIDLSESDDETESNNDTPPKRTPNNIRTSTENQETVHQTVQNSNVVDTNENDIEMKHNETTTVPEPTFDTPSLQISVNKDIITTVDWVRQGDAILERLTPSQQYQLYVCACQQIAQRNTHETSIPSMQQVGKILHTNSHSDELKKLIIFLCQSAFQQKNDSDHWNKSMTKIRREYEELQASHIAEMTARTKDQDRTRINNNKYLAKINELERNLVKANSQIKLLKLDKNHGPSPEITKELNHLNNISNQLEKKNTELHEQINKSQIEFSDKVTELNGKINTQVKYIQELLTKNKNIKKELQVDKLQQTINNYHQQLQTNENNNNKLRHDLQMSETQVKNLSNINLKQLKTMENNKLEITKLNKEIVILNNTLLE